MLHRQKQPVYLALGRKKKIGQVNIDNLHRFVMLSANSL
jgi:hypothetical protein